MSDDDEEADRHRDLTPAELAAEEEYEKSLDVETPEDQLFVAGSDSDSESCDSGATGATGLSFETQDTTDSGGEGEYSEEEDYVPAGPVPARRAAVVAANGDVDMTSEGEAYGSDEDAYYGSQLKSGW